QQVINPAYTGADETMNISALVRRQWFSVAGSPDNQTFAMHSPVKGRNIGLGLLMSRENMIVSQNYNFSAMYAYKIHFSEATLSLGLSAGVTSFEQELSTLQLPAGTNDPVFAEDFNIVTPTAGVGLYLQGRKFYFGASIPRLFERALENEIMGESSPLVRHYFVTGGYLFAVNPALNLKVHGLVKGVTGLPLTGDISTHAILYDKVWVGLTYRSLNSLNTLIQIQLSPSLRMGFSHDFISNDFAEIGSRSNEIMINYRVFRRREKDVVSPRYF
ncbi:MAG: type IX secretion system membrane protein PorP/SprF, partial [Bacteroidota bacterium]